MEENYTLSFPTKIQLIVEKILGSSVQVDEQLLNMFLELLEVDENFPQEVLQYENEHDKYYQAFLVYLMIPPYERNVATVCRLLYPELEIRTDSKSSIDKPFPSGEYIRLLHAKKLFNWDERARVWDDYIHRRTLARIAYIQQTAPLKAWRLLDSFIEDKAIKPEVRLKAANDVLDRTGYPRTTASISDSTIHRIEDIDAKQLKKMILDYLEAKKLAVPKDAPTKPAEMGTESTETAQN